MGEQEPSNLDKLEIEELDDAALEDAAGGAPVTPISTAPAPNGVQCFC